jgi:predicted GNAT family acetyltransferase
MNSPSYREDLDMVAEAQDGTFGALVSMNYDEKYLYGMFEPVCTHPEHRRKRLASTLMYDGLHRIRDLGASHCWVGTGIGMDANKLYESVGFTETYTAYTWEKVF